MTSWSDPGSDPIGDVRRAADGYARAPRRPTWSVIGVESRVSETGRRWPRKRFAWNVEVAYNAGGAYRTHTMRGETRPYAAAVHMCLEAKRVAVRTLNRGGVS